ncbi:MAG: flap endonuclease 1-like [Satyrvirus sp.]|uniref:Flap endonuclease 1-like n=1 Tax=Satyrvirus sp. TaxID=2487771 RepID=A0A3G5AFV9_9VIRU|nr:MAG: flap endonuclease 1-like [Satyrvirus sp.]
MALLYKNGVIDACQSDDMDMLPKGCGNVIQITKNGAVLQFLLPEILKKLELNYEQFVDFCILLGSDYNMTYSLRILPIELYNIFKNVPSLETFVEHYSLVDPKIITNLETYKKTRDFFLIIYEDIDKNISNHRLAPFDQKNIVNYFKQKGLQSHNIYGICSKETIQKINEFIMSVQ